MLEYIITYLITDPKDIFFKKEVDHKVKVNSHEELEHIETPKFLRGSHYDIINIRTKQQFMDDIIDSVQTQK